VLRVEEQQMENLDMTADIAFANENADGLLAPRVLEMCKARNWSLHWTARGAYLHLESSELIEAIRGKHGEPLKEAADVLIVLMSITESAGIPWNAVEQQARQRTAELFATAETPYPGEQRTLTHAT
jgi:NTP pyrophosphatase (non-canonical NTP hydrolase)